MKVVKNDIEPLFEKMFKEHFEGLCYFAKKYLGSIDLAKDIVHQVFMKIWENKDDFDWQTSAKSYLFTSVYNRSMNFIRDQKKFSEVDSDTVVETGSNIDFNDAMEASELEIKINTCVQNLPEKCRQVFEMSRYEGKKYREIAETLNISVKTVETQISKAIKILKEDLKDYLYLFILFLIKW